MPEKKGSGSSIIKKGTPEYEAALRRIESVAVAHGAAQTIIQGKAEADKGKLGGGKTGTGQ